MYNSRVMLQGDCNAPATFSCLVSHAMHKFLGTSVYIYLDNIFIFSDSRQQHMQHIREVCEKLKEYQLYSSPKKADFFSPRMKVLGHYIDDLSLHPDPEKIQKIKDWPTPTNTKAIQHFTTTVNYLSEFCPDLASHMAPLTELTGNKKFDWTPLCETAFQNTKKLADQAPILQPLNYESDDQIFLASDASTVGIGAWIGQGPTFYKARPASFYSRKLNSAEHNYPTHDLELLAIVAALRAFEHHLLGTKFTIITDHQSLQYFLSQRNLSPRQSRWQLELSKFDFDIQYIEGKKNLIADALSRLSEPKTSSPSATPDSEAFADVSDSISDLSLDTLSDMSSYEFVNFNDFIEDFDNLPETLSSSHTTLISIPSSPEIYGEDSFFLDDATDWSSNTSSDITPFAPKSPEIPPYNPQDTINPIFLSSCSSTA